MGQGAVPGPSPSTLGRGPGRRRESPVQAGDLKASRSISGIRDKISPEMKHAERTDAMRSHPREAHILPDLCVRHKKLSKAVALPPRPAPGPA